jgi:hypothetical protein
LFQIHIESIGNRAKHDHDVRSFSSSATYF